jgi:hypothetical protein
MEYIFCRMFYLYVVHLSHLFGWFMYFSFIFATQYTETCSIPRHNDEILLRNWKG